MQRSIITFALITAFVLSAVFTPFTQPAHANGSSSENKIVNVLFLGIDRSEERDKTLGVYRTDSISLVSINYSTKSVKVLCIPRDTYMYIPKIKKNDKINHAYVWGGMGKKGVDCTVSTLERFLKYVKVDFYFAIDMDPIPNIVNDLGGVKVNIEDEIVSGGIKLKKGTKTLNGKEADLFIRWRGTSSGDIGRIRRQYEFTSAALTKIKSKGNILNTIKMIMKYNRNIKTDMSLKDMVTLASIINVFDGNKVQFNIIPGRSAMVKKVWYWVPDKEKTEALLKKLYLKSN